MGVGRYLPSAKVMLNNSLNTADIGTSRSFHAIDRDNYAFLDDFNASFQTWNIGKNIDKAVFLFLFIYSDISLDQQIV